MLYFANPSTEPVRAAMRAGSLGCIITPKQGNVVPEGATWCADNGRFGKGYPGDREWFAWLADRIERFDGRHRCAFAVAPDVVGDPISTLRESLPWLPAVRCLGVPVAYVAQDGSEHGVIPWGMFDVLFLGGTDAFKLHAAEPLVREAVARGVPVHMGRVNSRTRLALCSSWGVTSADGTFISFGPDKNLPRMLRWIEETRRK